MKTIEEKLTASRAFLDTVCKPTYTIKHGIIARKANTTYSIQVRRKDSFADYFVIPHVGPAESEIVEIFHHLLGLSERDAVADEREEMMKTVDALSAMVTVDPVAFAELEAKNAALVAALEKIYAADNDPAIELIAKNALAANEKGGKGE